MSSASLSFWIILAIALQLALYLGYWFWRRRGDYRALREGGTVRQAAPAPKPGHDPLEIAPGSWSGFRTFQVERKVIEDAARSICSFYLVPADGQPLPSFKPGQFLTFGLDLPAADGGGRQVLRCYSLSDAPRPDYFRVSIKRVGGVPPGRSSNFFHDEVEVGDWLQLRAPAGHFHIDGGDAPVVLIAGGIGITPMLSMLEWCLAAQPQREVRLFYGVRHERELMMEPRLEALAAAHANFNLQLCISDPQEAVRGHRRPGRVDIGLLRAQLSLKPYHFYLCGPTALLESLVPALEDWGVPDERIHFEAFGPSSIKRRNAVPEAVPGDASIGVEFARSGRKVAWQPAAGNLLELAEANGLVLDSACRAGGCGTCQTKVLAGEVSYREAPDYDAAPGTCLPCVCTPKTELVLEA